MTEMIEEAKKVMARENNFTFMGEAADNEAGHVANMANQVLMLPHDEFRQQIIIMIIEINILLQLRAILHDIRIETMNYATVDHGVNDLRKYPHCGEVWAKIGKKKIYSDIYIIHWISNNSWVRWRYKMRK